MTSLKGATLLLLATIATGATVANSQTPADTQPTPPSKFPDPDRVTKLAAAFTAIDRLMTDFATKGRILERLRTASISR